MYRGKNTFKLLLETVKKNKDVRQHVLVLAIEQNGRALWEDSIQETAGKC